MVICPLQPYIRDKTLTLVLRFWSQSWLYKIPLPTPAPAKIVKLWLHHSGSDSGSATLFPTTLPYSFVTSTYIQVKCSIKNSIFSVYLARKPCKMPRKAYKNMSEFSMVFIKECILSKNRNR